MRQSGSAWQALKNNVRRVRRLRGAIREAGAPWVISFTDKINVLTLLACRRGPWKVVIAERSVPRRQWMGRVWEWLRRRTYPSCQALVVQTAAVADHARSLVRDRPVHVIPNAVRRPREVISSEERERRIVAMGRLAAEKGFDLLLQAFARIAEIHPDWTLEILGEGDARQSLEALAHELQIDKRVRFSGWIGDPDTAVRHAAVFVLSSRYEGFPNALLESMANGLACVSFDCDSGPADIIRDGEDGLLVPPEDVDALADALGRLMSDGAERARLGAAAAQAVGRFNYDAFFECWEEVLRDPEAN
jgi:glycosyltransferase involved in cell wall biosynthesis